MSKASLTRPHLEFNDYNGAVFTIRARSLNSLVYFLSEMIGAFGMGLLLDSNRFSRRGRAFLGWSMLFAIVFVVHIWAFMYQR